MTLEQTKVTVIEGVVHVATIGAQGPAGPAGPTKAYVDAGDTASRDRANHTGTQSANTITDGTTNKAYTATERTKAGRYHWLQHRRSGSVWSSTEDHNGRRACSEFQ